jgi:hypothetical protein
MSAPASASSATVAAPLGKWPGQSVMTCSRPRDIPPNPRRRHRPAVVTGGEQDRAVGVAGRGAERRVP